MNNFSFQRGWMQLRQQDASKAKQDLMSALNISSRAGWLKRLRGEVEPRVSEADAIVNIFKKYGIDNVWGE